jgi:hypothetical protein
LELAYNPVSVALSDLWVASVVVPVVVVVVVVAEVAAIVAVQEVERQYYALVALY